VVALLAHNMIVISHVGDSRMCVGQAAGPDGQVKVVQLTSDHKPERRDEHLRISNSGGRVGPSSHAVDPQTATMRVWSAHPAVHGPGLAVSRAFGDAVAHTCGVITVPEVRVRSIQPVDRWFMIASDGVWDVMSLADVGDTIERVAAKGPKGAWSPVAASKAIVSIARQRWRLSPQAMGRIDDITALVVRCAKVDPAEEEANKLL
jgi:serine/threonine protein phosphatase PrpC